MTAADLNLNFEGLDITSDALTLADVEKELEAFADNAAIRAILDKGHFFHKEEYASIIISLTSFLIQVRIH